MALFGPLAGRCRMNDRLSESAKKQEAARKIRATLVELWNVAKLGGLMRQLNILRMQLPKLINCQ